MTTKQAAQVLGLTVNAVTGAIKYGSMTAEKMRGQWDIAEEEVENYRQNHRGKPGNVTPEKAQERAEKAVETGRRNREAAVNISPEAEARIAERMHSQSSNPPVITAAQVEDIRNRLERIESALFRAGITP